MKSKRFFLMVICAVCFYAFGNAQSKEAAPVYKPFVNQAGYNLGESKRFVCYGAPDGTPFKIKNKKNNQVVFEGKMLNNQGWFTSLNPVSSGDEYVVEVDGRGQSVPFWIADHLMEKISSKLAYDFFVDVRGYDDLDKYDMSKVYGGGPSRDGGAYGLEAVFEVLQYAVNPALYDNWKTELGDKNVADLIDLILWHAEFAYKFINYNGPTGYRHGSLGYEGQPRMNYDYWNTLDHLAAVCAAYHSFLKPYLSEEKYQKYRKACLDNWEKYDRHKVVRYWTYSVKWVDSGFQEFNEMGNAFGQSVFSNLFMYLCEKNEKDGHPEKFLKYAQESAQDIITNWDFNNPRHMWWIRNAEHITPQALAWFLMVAPDQAPAGTKEKLVAWANHMKQKTNNFWKYRMHSETEWAHPKTKELGGAPALAGSMFAVSHILNDQSLRDLGWAQVDFVFGVNPVGTHLSNKSEERVKIGGYWDGVEEGWPQAHPNGYGRLGLVRGTLDGTPLDNQFPIAKNVEKIIGQNEGQVFGKNAYATEGWCISNRGWEATVTFATLGSQQIKLFDAESKNEISQAKSGQTITIELKAALNQDWNKIDKGWVEIKNGNELPQKLEVTETGANSGIFTAKYSVPKTKKGTEIKVSYGYLGLGVESVLIVH
ncbi:MAG: cellulase N-terminal Ig-like domain-containing protein [Bacteroidota bacterium]|nr:cellulase N-terminal Ig-like domain-containing protein [Bacteroidota bacterium]